jgi:hypothetical protein
MAVFDAPDREFCVVKRSMTNTPLQALTLMNDPIYLEAARKLAERSFEQQGVNSPSRLSFMFRLATGRLPTTAEQSIMPTTYDRMLSEYQSDGVAASALTRIGIFCCQPAIPVADWPQLLPWQRAAQHG